MAKAIVLFKNDGRKVLQNVSAFLRQLADRFAQTQIILRTVEEEFAPDFPNKSIHELRIEERDKKGKTMRTLEIVIGCIDRDEFMVTKRS
jgi:hypothetical protein